MQTLLLPQRPRHDYRPGYPIAIDELTEGLKDLRKTRLTTHIADGIQAAAPGYATDSISIPLLTTTDGSRIKLTALPTARYGTRRRGILAQEVFGRRGNGLSYRLLDSLKKKCYALCDRSQFL
jgi:hypothetical protein